METILVYIVLVQILPPEIRSAAGKDGETSRQGRNETVAAMLEPAERPGDRCTPEHDDVLRFIAGGVQLPKNRLDLLLVDAIKVGDFTKRRGLHEPSHQTVTGAGTITRHRREMNQPVHARLVQGELEDLAGATDVPPLLCGERTPVELTNLECEVHDRVDLRRSHFRLPVIRGKIGLDPLNLAVGLGGLRLGFEVYADEALDPGNVGERVDQG